MFVYGMICRFARQRHRDPLPQRKRIACGTRVSIISLYVLGRSVGVDDGTGGFYINTLAIHRHHTTPYISSVRMPPQNNIAATTRLKQKCKKYIPPRMPKVNDGFARAHTHRVYMINRGTHSRTHTFLKEPTHAQSQTHTKHELLRPYKMTAGSRGGVVTPYISGGMGGQLKSLLTCLLRVGRAVNARVSCSFCARGTPIRNVWLAFAHSANVWGAFGVLCTRFFLCLIVYVHVLCVFTS